MHETAEVLDVREPDVDVTATRVLEDRLLVSLARLAQVLADCVKDAVLEVLEGVEDVVLGDQGTEATSDVAAVIERRLQQAVRHSVEAHVLLHVIDDVEVELHRVELRTVTHRGT